MSFTVEKPPLPAFYDDLDLTLDEILHRLRDGARNRHSAFHTPAVATVTPQGAPDVRTMVLRGVDNAPLRLRFHTDKRTGKAYQLSQNPLGFCEIYDSNCKIQLRLACDMTLLDDGETVERAWAQTRPMSRACYQTETAPGTEIPAPGAVVPDTARIDEGRSNFAVLMAEITTMEWLYLAARGHARARFERDGTHWTGCWLAP
ncbi:pyridoxamine 5'-phosphate oxidase family protein [Stappia sp. ES.058]|uniref:pyridoxamine 5'-phosphate oxidase family protein n=1 Tax=Stappia sp. ES.058 TaxID=1881061 RepID=UPI00087A55BA|nr:pyridoxamine 5'-phosphate oxidase family protein [Stappia sp. ES.058]SDU07309.1 3-hydroxyisobutyrate dehydrogenase [Stappia sp. ES.058]